MCDEICIEWDILHLENKLVMEIFLNYLKHFFGISVLHFLVTYQVTIS